MLVQVILPALTLAAATPTPAAAKPAPARAAAKASPAPRPTLVPATIERAVKDAVLVQVPAEKKATTLRSEITVTDWYDDLLVLPDYSPARKPLPYLGTLRGGASGSPSFDVVSQRYWWEE